MLESTSSVSSPVKCEAAEGWHNANWDQTRDRLVKGATYRDCSTVCVVPTKDGYLHDRVRHAVNGLIKPPNQAYTEIPVPVQTPLQTDSFALWRMTDFEVGDAYNAAINGILADPNLSKWKFLLTIEHDNLPPPDGLMKLIESMYNSPYAAISGLYYTKGFEGCPQIWGDPSQTPINYAPQWPKEDTLQECRGIGMGFAIWDMNLFKDERLKSPWFETKAEYEFGKGAQVGTQDLVFAGKATKFGYRFAVDTRVRVGHMDLQSGMVW